MTNNPQTPDPTPESARALLYRHGLPEDVIDGALCLHAQELAAVQREALTKTDDPVFYGGEAGWLVDLIDPTQGDPQPTVLPAVPVPPTTHAAEPAGAEIEQLRERLEEAEDTAEQLVRNVQTVAREREGYRRAWKEEQQRRVKAEHELRRMAGEAQQQPEVVPCMRSEAHPPHLHSGLRKGVAVHGRCPGGSAAPVQQPAPGPGRVADEEPAEARQDGAQTP